MTTTYPTTLDVLTRPNPGDPLALSNGKSQTQILDDAQDAIEALEAKVGVNGSAVAGTVDKKLADNATTIAAHTSQLAGLGTMATQSAAAFLPLLANGAAVEDVGAIESRVLVVASSGASQALDTSLYAVFDVTLSAACTFTFTNPAPSGKNSTFSLVLRGAFTPTLPASVKWSSGTPPTYMTPSLYVFTTNDAGTTWFASQVGKAFA